MQHRATPRFALALAIVIALFPFASLPLTATAAPRTAAKPPAATAGKKPSRRRPTHRRRVIHERRLPAMRGKLPNVQALGAVVIDLETGREIYGRNPDQRRAIASVSKLAAALVVAERGLELEGLTTIKPVDIEVAKGGAPSRLPLGMTLSNRDLLHAALLGSDNRAMAALGRAVGLGSAQFAEQMNKKMTALGLKQTRFREPTGLSPENVSTPRESIRLLQAALAIPMLAPVLARMEYDAHPVSRPAIKYINTHRPARRSNTEVLGGKTGYTDVARYCLVLIARIDGRSYGLSLLSTEGKMTRFGDVARVADWLVAHKPFKDSPAPAAVASPSSPVMPPALPTTPAAIAAQPAEAAP